jgi:hypothetical protein
MYVSGLMEDLFVGTLSRDGDCEVFCSNLIGLYNKFISQMNFLF